MRTASALTISLTLSIACAATRPAPVIPDPNVPHRVAQDGELWVWLRTPEGPLVKQRVKVAEGWWIASPQVVEPRKRAALEARLAPTPRNRQHMREFRRQWSAEHGGLPCPTGCQTFVLRDEGYVEYERCGACEVDHKCALACGGPDTVANMHWMDKLENLRKGDDCGLCHQ